MSDDVELRRVTDESLLPEALLEEYRSLRAEIGRLQDDQKEIMNFAFLVLLALATAAAAIHDKPTFRLILFFIPWAYFLLAAAYTDRTLRILLPADYIHNKLRPQIMTRVHAEIWGWEDYKRDNALFSRQISWTLDKFRWLVFVLPALFGAAFFVAKSWPPVRLDAVWVTLDLGALALALFVMFIADESGGIYNPCDLIIRPKPPSGWLSVLYLGLPFAMVVQFPVVAYVVPGNGLILAVSLLTCSAGFAVALVELLFHINYQLRADREHVYRITLFGAVDRWDQSAVSAAPYQPGASPAANRLPRWLRGGIVITSTESGLSAKQRTGEKFRVWGSGLQKYVHGAWRDYGSDEPAQANPKLSQLRQASDELLRAGEPQAARR